MQKQLNCNLKLTLKDIALRRVAVCVWNEPDILNLIETCKISVYSDDKLCIWREIFENKVKDKVLKLVLPESLKQQMVHLVTPMSVDILTWKMYHEKILSDSREHFNLRVLERLRRTSTGAVDYRKTAEELVRLGMFDAVKRYKLACLYCLVDYIAALWEELPEGYQLRFYNDDYSLPIMETQLEFYWPYILKGEESKLDNMLGVSFCQRAFQHSARKGNKAATQYFFEKLPSEERDAALFRTVNTVVRDRLNIRLSRSHFDFPIEKHCDVVSYLLSLLSPEQQLKFLKDHPCDIFRCFLDCPWKELFLDISDFIWTFLPESSYDELLSLLIANVRHSDYYSPNFLQEFFVRSPSSFKKQLVFRGHSLFPNFFSAEDTETIKVVFRNLDVEDRVRLVSGYYFFELLNGRIMADKWQLVELCLREATLSKEEMKKLKGDYIGFLAGIDPRTMRLMKRKWRVFFQFLDETDVCALNKRRSEGKMLTKAKKSCNE